MGKKMFLEKRKNLLIVFSLIIILAFSALLLIYYPWNAFFQEHLRYAADDGVYHMRLIENMLLGSHAPQRIYFDAFTYFPHGTYIHFAPAYDYILAGVIWIVSWGNPTIELINTIAPFYPPFLGVLSVLVVFLIGKILWGNLAGLLAAFFLSVSPPFVFRSVLGATDHHQAEVLYSSLTLLFLILLFQNLENKKKFITYTILTGIGLGLYFLNWSGALLYLFIIFLTIISYYALTFVWGKPKNKLLISGIVIFAIAFLMITPFLGYPDLFNARLYNINHVVAISMGILLFAVMLFASWFFKKVEGRFKLKKWDYLIVSAFSLLLFVVVLQKFLPSFFLTIVESFQAIQVGHFAQHGEVAWREHARELIGEMGPLGLQGALGAFGYLFYISFIGLAFVIYDFVKKRKAEYLLIIIWFSIILMICGVVIESFGQRRFGYYLSVIIALVVSFIVVKTIYFVSYSLKNYLKERKKKRQPQYLIYQLLASIFLVFAIIFFVFVGHPLMFEARPSGFPYNLPYIISNPIMVAQGSPEQRPLDWYETLDWLRENTPDPGVDYYGFYEAPRYNSAKGRIDSYEYPSSAYGVMSTWDVGHLITYLGRRIPNSNPFQQGLGRREEFNIVPGEATFFIETDELKAVDMLKKLRTKYVITDAGMVSMAYGSMVLWAIGDLDKHTIEEDGMVFLTSEFDNSMSVRLHSFDGRAWQRGEDLTTYVPHLNHFRLVYESNTIVDISAFADEILDEKAGVRFVKIFELVNGAKVVGRAQNGSIVEISTNITTNQGRKFVYKKSVEVKNGVFEFILPYSTQGKDGWLEGGTKFEVFAEPYVLRYGNTEKEIFVSENDVIMGNEIAL